MNSRSVRKTCGRMAVWFGVCFGLTAGSTLVGCDGAERVARLTLASTFHGKHGWRAEDFFTDPLVIELCRAIEANDLDEIDRLVAAGADVNALGKDNMTPLLWAFPDNKLPRFTRLLEHGADPNVKILSRMNAPLLIGDCVTTMAARTSFPGYLEAVLEHGGDPNIRGWLNETPIRIVITNNSDKKRRIRLLLDAGADINAHSWQTTPVMDAASWGTGDFSLVLFLLEAGADPAIRREKHLDNFPEFLAFKELYNAPIWSDRQRREFAEVVRWLEDRGYDFDAARSDVARWSEWNKQHNVTRASQTLMRQELLERVEKEKLARPQQPPDMK